MPKKPLRYPDAHRGSEVDEIHGVKVGDPYRWLEDIESDETMEWVSHQSKLTDDYLASLPGRTEWNELLTELHAYDRVVAPIEVGGNLFFYHRSATDPHFKLYTQRHGETEPTMLIDSGAPFFGEHASITSVRPSPDGKLLTYGTTTKGSDWQTWRIVDQQSGAHLKEKLECIKFPFASWMPDGSGFFYCRFDALDMVDMSKALGHQKLCFHQIGTDQIEDVVILERPTHPDWMYVGKVTEDGNYLVLMINRGADDRSLVYIANLENGVKNLEFRPVTNSFTSAFRLIGSVGSLLYFRTDENALNGRICTLDASSKASKLTDVIPEGNDSIRGASMIADHILVEYLTDAHSRVEVFDQHGSHRHSLRMPGVGSVSGLLGDQSSERTFYTFTSFSHPPTCFEYFPVSNVKKLYQKPSIDFDGSGIITKQYFVRSVDGLKIPFYIICRKDIKLDGRNPAYLYGYGGFNTSLTPLYSPNALAWAQKGGVYVVANLRGGGEFGEQWHQAGMKHNKKLVFDDFAAVAGWLHKTGYSSPSHTALGGRSNGGLLAAATMIRHPHICRAAAPAVGVLDMLRFHKFTIGWAWQDEYGSPQNKEEFLNLLSYSPLHNLQAGRNYPATLVLCASNDDRVFPAHSFKFVAALQHAQAGSRPVLMRIDRDSGHGAGRTRSQMVAEVSDLFTFLWSELGN